MLFNLFIQRMHAIDGNKLNISQKRIFFANYHLPFHVFEAIRMDSLALPPSRTDMFPLLW